MAQSSSVVCIHMNVDKSQPRGKEKSCKCHNCCSSNAASTPYLSKKRTQQKLCRKHTSLPRRGIASNARSSESLSSDGSNGVVWQPDVENSKQSSSNSTSTTVSRDKRAATNRSGILREDKPHSPAVRPKSRIGHTGTRSHGRRSRSTSDNEDQPHSPVVRPKSRVGHTGTRSHGRRSRSTSDNEDQPHSPVVRPKSRVGHTGTRSHGRRSRSTSGSVSSLDGREESTRLTKSKLKRQSPDIKKTSYDNHRKHHNRDHLSVKSAKHKTLSRTKSPTTSSRSTSRSYSESDVSSVNLESDFVPESRSKKSWKKLRHLTKKMQSESEYSNDSDRTSQYVEAYSHNTLCKPDVHSVELINTIGIVNDACPHCSSGRGQNVCVCQPSMNRQQISPACLVCSQCYAVPCCNKEHSQRMLASNCVEIPCTACRKKPHTRDEHSHRKTNRQKSGRSKSPEKRKRRGHSKHSHQKREVNETCLYSCNCADCRSQFYQCNLLLGQCCTPVTARQCVVFHRDNQCNQTHNRRESQCTLNESQISDTPASKLSDTPASKLSDIPASRLSED